MNFCRRRYDRILSCVVQALLLSFLPIPRGRFHPGALLSSQRIPVL